MAEHWSQILSGKEGMTHTNGFSQGGEDLWQRYHPVASRIGETSAAQATGSALKQYGGFLKDHWSTILKDPAQGLSNALENTFQAYPSDRGINALSEYYQTGAIPEDLPELDMNRVGGESLDFINPVINKMAVPLMTAWHGTPHLMKGNKVDLSKVGTGEGAQAYGHGFYAAENKGVGQRYKETLGGRTVETERGRFPLAEVRQSLTDHESEALNIVTQLQGDYKMAKAWAKENQPEYVDAIDFLEKNVKIDPGHLYELDIPDEQINKMLDWDKPLSEQPESVRKALEKSGLILGVDRIKRINELEKLKDKLASDRLPNNRMRDEKLWFQLSREHEELIKNKVDIPYYGMKPDMSWGSLDQNSPTGNAIYEALQTKIGGQQAASEYLNSLGIPGIRYLDATSRSAGEGTRNFVIFDENIVTPLSRNGEPINTLAPKPLPMDEASRMQRAREMGFDVDNVLYHGTLKEFTEFNPSLGPEYGIYLTPRQKYAEGFGKGKAGAYHVSLKNPKIVEWKGDISPADLTKADVEKLQAEGHDGIIVKNKGGNISSASEVVLFDPKNIRSRFAAFDPAKKDSANILAGAAGAGVALHWSQILNGEDNALQTQ